MVNSGVEATTFIADDWVPLTEAVVADDGTIPICIIETGWSKNGRHYSESVLRDAASIYRAGTHNLWNHPGPAALREQPGGDLNAIASVLADDARYLTAAEAVAEFGEKAKAGLYSRARPISIYRERILELAKVIGLSHRVRGRQVPGSAEGRRGMIVTEILDPSRHPGIPPVTVDWVAHPAAGGAPLTEEENVTMTDDEIQEQVSGAVNAAVAPLNEKIAAKDAEITTLREAIAKMTSAAAIAILREELARAGLPDAAARRLEQQIGTQAGEDFDPEKYRTTIAAAIEDEKAYIKAVAPGPEPDEKKKQEPERGEGGPEPGQQQEGAIPGKPPAPNPGVRQDESIDYLAICRELRR